MTLKRFVALAASLAVITALPWIVTAGVEAGAREQDRTRTILDASMVDLPEVHRPDLVGLRERQPYQKLFDHELRLAPEESGRLIVKFKDSVQARPVAQVRGQLVSRTGRDVNEFQELVERFDLTVEPAILMSEQRLANVETRAATRSGKAQPDLAGLVHVTGPRHRMEQVARAINAMDTVEFVDFEPEYKLMGGFDPVGACCVDNLCVPFQTEAGCVGMGGTYLGDDSVCSSRDCVPGACCNAGACTEEIRFTCEQAGGTFYGAGTVCGDFGCDDGNCCLVDTCANIGNQFDCRAAGGLFIAGTPCGPDNPCEDFQLECGDGGGGDCFTIHGTPYCNDDDCCEAVCEIFPFCCEEPFGFWDEPCLHIAHLFCDIQSGANRCFSAFAGECFETSPFGGCNRADCCLLVCDLDPTCCENNWRAECVALAFTHCLSPTPDIDTPDFTLLQGYLTPEAYTDMPYGTPSGLEPPVPDLLGYRGEGFDLQDPRDPLDPQYDPYRGLYGLARELLEVYGVGQEMVDQGLIHPLWGGARGATIKVGVVEWAWWEGHEDLDVTTVLPEGDQMILIPDATNPDHGTASLGIIAALENGFGMTGIAPDAEAYFFPITSINQGPRNLTAIAEALELFDEGDVLSFSYGPSPGNLNTREMTHALFAIGRDLGITCLVAAGNDCYNLDQALDHGGDGAIVVGASQPGWPYRRATFSNYYKQDDPELIRGNTVHISAWGLNVASLGYGDVFRGDNDPRRSYTKAYNGTSAATPMMAGLAACLQGFAKQFYGIPLSAEKVLNALRYDAFPQPAPAFPEEDGYACGPDYNPQEPTNVIVGFPRARRCGVGIIAQEFLGFDDNMEIKQVHTLRGEHIHGNVFSLRQEDGIFYRASSEQTSVTSGPSNIPDQWRHQLNNITYITSGQIVDVLTVIEPDVDVVTGLAVFAIGAPTTVNSLSVIELYDWNARKWVVGGATYAPAGTPLAVGTFPFFGSTRFARSSDNTVLVRTWVVGFPTVAPFGSAPISQTFEVRWDLLDVNVSGFVNPVE